MKRMTVLNVGYGKTALVEEYYKGNMSSRHFYGSIEMERDGKYDIQNISLDSRQSTKGAVHNNLLMAKKADVIFMPYLFVAPLFFIATLKHLKLRKTKIIVICHTTMKKSYNRVFNYIYKWIYSSIDTVFFHSKKNMEESIANESVKSSNARFLYWGDDLDYIDKMFPNPNLGDFFISTGREQRDYESLISAFAGHNIPLEIYTNRVNYDNHYDYLDEIKDKYSNIQIEYVERTNESTTKLTKRTSECLCVVIPLKKDHINYCLGLTSIVEAMAMGKPVICTYNPYSPIDIEKEGIGLTVNEDRSWEEAITYIISHREKAQEMGLRGRILAEKHFNIRKCFELVDEAIEKKD